MKTNFWVALLAALLTTSTASAGILYAIDDSTNTLLRIDPITAVFTTVGNTGVATGDFGDLSFNPLDGKLYWVPGRGNNALYTIDPNTGLATLVGSHGIVDLFALAWDTTHNLLYADAADGSLYTLDSGTGAAALVGANNVYPPGGLTYHQATDMLYLLGAGTDELHMIDTFSGSAFQVASNNLGVGDNGIAYDPENDVYWVASTTGDLYQYNATFSSRTTYSYGSPLDGITFAAATTATPEPGTFILLGGGLVAASLLKRRRG